MLRAVELLNNAVDGQLPWWEWARFGLIWGEGKAHIDEYNYLLGPDAARDAHAAIDFYCSKMDAKTEAVVNHVLKVIGTPDADPRLEAVKAELRPIFFESSGSGATWLSGADLQASGPDGRPRSIFQPRSDQALRIGLLEDGTPLTFSGDESLISIAPPGSGKTQCNVFPNLLTWRGPAVVLDISGDLYEKTSKWRSEHVGPVYKFSPLEPQGSHHYNPLTFVRSEADYIWEDARLLADMMIVPSGGADQFWENEARTVLTAAIAHVCYANTPPNRPMHAVLDIMHGGRAWDEMIMGLRMAVDVRVMVQHGQSLSTMNEKTLSSVMQTARSSLGAWGGERVARVTDRSDWSPLDLRDGSNPTIYIYMRPNEVDAYLSLIRVFIGQHIRMLTGGAVPPADAKKILFMLDELPRLKNMPPIDEALNIGRKYKLQLWLFAQSLGQLEEAYKNGKGMIGSCGVRIYMNPGLQDGMAESLSEQIGYKQGALDGVRGKVVEASALAGPDWGDYQIVLGTASKPGKVKKAFAWQDPELASRMGSL
ncbi:type IV secretory system conjugative DNA transfer family protein [Aquabacterium sp.]|uniref:type IV secretory system conjugative DNA transfer family protein n=1 Tax=Aquabacterium sp. TaxID=1872578 RepID=UPI0024886405|nr:type IV secretory system conjugative DNA transfer family protein [Aquabacterium sp.]MDI1260081.1 type IV secretory system conjugative DNA transfer family protein [Aquabacterium sp.]